MSDSNESSLKTTNKRQRQRPEPLKCLECGYEHRNGHKLDCSRYGRMSSEYFIQCLYPRIYAWNMARGALDVGRRYREPRNTGEMSAEIRMENASAHIDALVLERAESIRLEQETRAAMKDEHARWLARGTGE